MTHATRVTAAAATALAAPRRFKPFPRATINAAAPNNSTPVTTVSVAAGGKAPRPLRLRCRLRTRHRDAG
jgi:hypothetical protein